MIENNGPKAANKLKRQDSYRLTFWYQQNQERLLKITDAETRMEVEKELGLAGLSDAHIAGVRKTLGIEKRVLRAADKKGGADVEALECLVNEQADKIERLQAAVQGLLDRVRRLETTR